MLLSKMTLTVQAALLAEEARAQDDDRLSALKVLHADLWDVAQKHAATIGLTSDDMTTLAAAPKDPPPNN